MELIFIVSAILFAIISFVYSYLAIKGLAYKDKEGGGGSIDRELVYYPSVDIFVPAKNEAVVIKNTIESLVALKYKGDLQIYILNDNSEDDTGIIAGEFADRYKNVHNIQVPLFENPGKSKVLNYALTISKGKYFVVYDGDNQPNEDAVELLMKATLRDEKIVGAVGTVRTINANKNILTRMIAIEFQIFQLILQAGRWTISKTGSLPGTNMMLKRDVIVELGGYDEKALAEDAELTVRLASQGYAIAVEPRSITWEQEPETIKSLLRQRTRWLQGNLYLTLKFLRHPSWWTRKGLNHIIHYVTVYFVYPISITACNVIFIICLLGLASLDLNFPFTFIWFILYFIYTVQVLLAQWYDGTLGVKNMLVGVVMYFSYAQLFMLTYIRAIWFMFRAKKTSKLVWEKTDRVDTSKNI